MSPLDVFRSALISLGTNKLRTILALLGIVIGVAAVISTMAVGKGAQERITSRIESLGTNLLFVRPVSDPNNVSSLTLDDAYSLLDQTFSPSVLSVAPEIGSNAQIVAGREANYGQVLGVTPEYESVRNYEISSGQFISSGHVSSRAEVAVLGASVAETLFGFRNPVGQNVRINGRQFSVIGILKSRGGSGLGNLDNQTLVPITTAYYRLGSQRTTQGNITVQNINVQINKTEDIDEAVAEINTVLRLRHRLRDESDFTITSQQETIDTLRETTQTFVIFLSAIAGISLLVGGIGIMNIMLVSVTERIREIGIRKAMGAKKKDVLSQFILEAVLLSLGGGIVGASVGIGLSRFMDGQTLGGNVFNTVVTGDITILAILVSAAIGLCFGIDPAYRAANLHPIEALRYE